MRFPSIYLKSNFCTSQKELNICSICFFVSGGIRSSEQQHWWSTPDQFWENRTKRRASVFRLVSTHCQGELSCTRKRSGTGGRSNTSNTRDSVSSDFQTQRRELKIWHVAAYFWRNSRCLEIRWNTVSTIFLMETKTKE